jgi:hypothetical protein
MKQGILLLIISVLIITGCKNNKGPDVSSIKVDLEVARFEKDFFAIDTNRIYPSLVALTKKYPGFMPDYVNNIMGLRPIADTSVTELAAIKGFLKDYRPVYDSSQRVFRSMDDMESDLVSALKHVRYYFPEYKLPTRVITFIGPMDALFQGSLASYGDAITQSGLAVGLQLHMGANYSLYTSEMGQSLYPRYISKRFTPETVPVNAVKNIIDDLYPDQSASKTLVEQMVEKGKRMYLLDRFMPNTNDSLKTGYTAAQLKGCKENEGLIWNFFLTNSLVYNNDPSIIKSYIGDAPNTAELGEGSPGYIGLFVGWKIVEKFMEKNKEMKLQQLMTTDAREVFEESKYRPK